MNIRKFVATGLAVFAALWFFGHCTACLTDQAKKDVAQDVYAAQQAACIDQYADKPSIDKCRDRVKKAWLATDAGADAGTRTLAFGNNNGHPDAGDVIERAPHAARIYTQVDSSRVLTIATADAGTDAEAGK